jgi:hypothetical protein
MTFKQIKDELGWILALLAFVLSGASFYVSYIYKNEDLQVQVTSVSYPTNQGEVYMTVAFSNAGNRDAALLRVEPALWSKPEGSEKAEWRPLDTKVAKDIPLTEPRVPTTVKAGGVEVIRLAAKLPPDAVENSTIASQGAAFLGVIVASMNSDGNLYLVQHAVAKLEVDAKGRIHGAQATIHRSLPGFTNLEGPPPGDQLQKNEKTPFVWADQHN